MRNIKWGLCILSLAFVSAAHAVPMTSNAEFDVGSTLINFDTLTSGDAVNTQYTSLGVTISGTTGNSGTGGSTTVRAANWDPIYIGNQDNGWNGSIIFDLSAGATQFGLELIDSIPSYLEVYDAANNLIESFTTTASGSNIFVGIDTGSTLFTKAIISGNFYAVDDVQFNVAAVPEPTTLALLALGLVAIGARKRKLH